MTSGDFSKRKSFPGETGNPLDILLFFQWQSWNKSRPPLFAILLVTLAHLRFWGNWPMTLTMAAFFLTDWLMLLLLPKLNRSFGPSQPPTTLLVLMRLVFTLLPSPWMVLVQCVGTYLIVYGFWIEPHRIHVTQQTLVSSKLKSTNHPLRLLHLGDLHIERSSQREKQLNELIDHIAPDVIVFSGDFLNLTYRTDPTAMQAARQIISQWHAPLGIYMVTGSPAVDFPEIVTDILAGLPVKWLQNESVILEHETNQINLIGLSCSHRPHKDAPILTNLAPQEQALNILLYHSPDLAPEAAQSGIDLQLSGHTHGGQIRLPWYGALVTGSLYGKRFEAGRYQIEDMVLYVTRGIGLEGAAAPRVRFLCPPEIVLWEISS